MGLGKTIQSIAFLYEIFNMGIRGPFLIIAPLSTITNWEREFRTWTHMNVIVYHGSQISRQMILQYEMFYRDQQVTRITRRHSCFSAAFLWTSLEWSLKIFPAALLVVGFIPVPGCCPSLVPSCLLIVFTDPFWLPLPCRRVWYTNVNAYFMFLEEFPCFFSPPLNFKLPKTDLWLVSDSDLKSRLYKSAVFYCVPCPQGNTIPSVLKFHGLITTFEMIMADCPELRKLHWRCVVIDEAHRLKNKNCKLLEGLKLMNLVGLFKFHDDVVACFCQLMLTPLSEGTSEI